MLGTQINTLMKSDTSTKAFPLVMASVGEWVQIVGVRGGKDRGKNLTELGLVDRVKVQVFHHERDSGMVVIHKGTRVALGKMLVRQVMVVPVLN
ncbi:MAG TPA: ferrous iron transport protein A [Thioploca sp.]|nr:ferrous iron transport protein A [Thioploca sp.]